jgi:hypothetical protein
MLIATIFPNQSELLFGQGVLHGDLQCSHYQLVYIHKLTPKIKEVMEFQKWLIVKLISGKSPSLETRCIALFGPLKQIFSKLVNFYRFAHL